MAIFSHQNGDEYFEVLDEGSHLTFLAREEHREAATRVVAGRGAVARLHSTLGEWLESSDVTRGEIAEGSLIDQLIMRRVAEEVARVLPLHLSPFAMQMQAAEDKIGRIANALMSKPDDDDPEPGDVGHPVEPAPECPADCPCDHRPGVRQPSKYEDASADISVSVRSAAESFRSLADASASVRPTWDDKLWGMAGTPPTEPYCTECMHSWSRHLKYGIGCNAVMPGDSLRPYCGCKAVQP